MRARVYDFSPRSTDPTPTARRTRRGLGPGTLVLLLVGSATLLYLLGGPPQPPARPDPRAVLDAMTSARPPLQGAASWCFALSWALWLWTAVSFVMQVLLALLDAATRGASWVRALRPAVAPFLMPLARRAFPVVATGMIVAKLIATPTPAAAAAPVAIVRQLPDRPDAAGPGATPLQIGAPRATAVAVEHVVSEGDTLRDLALRYYGTGDEFGRLHEANLDRPMPDGTRYAGRLKPGQVLRVPSASLAIVQVDGERSYTVERGDTLRGIAARFLGDEMRWPEIFAINRGIAGFPDGRRLTDPDLIWPGLVLALPAGEVAPAPPPPVPPAPPPPIAPPTPPPPPPPPATSTPAPPPSASPTPVASPAPLVAATPTAVPTKPPASVQPTAVATPIPSQPSSAPAADTSPGRAPLLVGAGALGLAVLGSATFLNRRHLLARRELRRRLRAAPAPTAGQADESALGGFAEADPTEVFTHRAYGGEVEPTVAIAHHAARLLGEEGFNGATPLLVAQLNHGDAVLLLSAPLDERDRLIALAPRLGALLGGKGLGLPVRASGDVEFHLTALTAAGLLAPIAPGAGRGMPTMLPLAELPGGVPLLANWDALGHLLVAGGLGEGGDAALTALAAILASRRHPDTLRLWAIAHPQTLPAELFRLPHWGDPRIDPDDDARVTGLLADLRAELDRRRGEPPDTPRPELVLVLGEVADLTRRLDDGLVGTSLELLATDGPAHGIRIVGATARPEALDEGFLRHLATRLVLPLGDEAGSVRLLGVPDATRLAGGHLLLRPAGRAPRGFAGVAADRVRGYRIAPEALRTLAEQMQRAYRPSVAPEQPPPDVEEAHRDEESGGDETPGAVAPPPDTETTADGTTDSTDTAASDTATGICVDAPDAEPSPDAGTVDTAAAGAATAAREAEAPVAGTSDDDIQSPDMATADRSTAVSVELDPVDRDSVPHDPPHGDVTMEEERSGTGHDSATADTPVIALSASGEPGGPARATANGHAATSAIGAPGDGTTTPSPDLSPAEAEKEPTITPRALTDGDPTRRAGRATGEQSASHIVPETSDPLTADSLLQEPVDEPPVDTPIEIRCFGPLQVRHAGRLLAPIRHLKAWELLQLLAAKPPRSVTKEKLAVALWPDPDMSLSRNTFNVVVMRLREELTAQVPGLSRDVVGQTRGGECWLDPGLVTSDVHTWLAIIEREPKQPLAAALAGYRRAAQLYRPALLEGAGFEWLSSREEGVDLGAEYRGTWRRYALRLARRCTREDRPDLSLPLYRRLMDEQPRDEPVLRELYRCYGRVGDLQGLEREARVFAGVLRRGYGDEQDPEAPRKLDQPQDETTRVYTEVRRALLEGGGARSGLARASPAPTGERRHGPGTPASGARGSNERASGV